MRAKWLVIAAIVALDALGLSCLEIRLSLAGLARGAGAIFILGGLVAFYSYRRPNARILDAAQTLAQLLAFFAAAAILSYLATALDFRLVDSQLAAADRWLGFDWPAWFVWVRLHPTLQVVLRFAYISATPQTAAIALYLAFTGQFARTSELLWAIMLSLFMIIPISTIWPAASAWVQYDVTGLVDAVHMPDFTALRSGTLRELDLTRLEGLITFPSFHTTLAVLFAYAVRDRALPFAAAILLNTVMIVSVLTEGGHYLVDVISGAAVAAAAAWATARLEAMLGKRSEPLSARSPLAATDGSISVP